MKTSTKALKKGETISARECLIAWNPLWLKNDPAYKPGLVVVTRLDSDEFYHYASLAVEAGAISVCWRDCPEEELNTRLMVLFHSLVVRDGLDVKIVHEAFLQIREYREIIAPDSPGL